MCVGVTDNVHHRVTRQQHLTPTDRLGTRAFLTITARSTVNSLLLKLSDSVVKQHSQSSQRCLA